MQLTLQPAVARVAGYEIDVDVKHDTVCSAAGSCGWRILSGPGLEITWVRQSVCE